jgi:hypothetical protein
MPDQMRIGLIIEILFVASSFVLLNRAKGNAPFAWAGMVALCLTFCWSVIFGCVVALNQLSYRI